MTLRPLAALAALLTLAAAPAQTPVPAAQPSPQPNATPSPVATVDADPALWRVQDKDTTIYLFGTIHVLKPGLGWFDEAVAKAFQASDQVVVEMIEPTGDGGRDGIIKRAMAKDGQPLTAKLPPDKRDAFTAALKGIGLPANGLDQFAPWFAAVTLVQAPMGQLGYQAEEGVERRIAAAAKAAGKPMVGLETFDQQIGFLANLSDEAQLKFLVSTVDELPDTGKVFAEMIDSWSKGEPDRLAALMNDTLKDEPEVEKTLLTDRNKAWAGWIAERMKTPGTVFLAVGAGHLAGPNSVQEQLKAYRLDAKRVRY